MEKNDENAHFGRTFWYHDAEPVSKENLPAACKSLQDLLAPAGFEMKKATDRVYFEGMFLTALPQVDKNGAVHYEVVAELICPICAEYSSTKAHSLGDLRKLNNEPHTCGISMIDTGQWRRNKQNK